MKTKIYLDSRRSNDGLAAVRISIGQSGKTAYITVDNVRVDPERWDGRAVVGMPNSDYLNAQIYDMMAKVSRAVLMIGDTDGMTAVEIRDAVMNVIRPGRHSTVRKKHLLTELLRAHGEKVRPNTRSLYEYAASVVERYSPATDVTKIDRRWLEGLDGFMTAAMHLKTNTRSIVLRNIRTAYNEALGEGLVSNYPFRQFKIKSEDTEKRSLTVEELRTLLNYQCDEWQKVYVDYFFLCFYLCGINLVDLSALRDSDMHSGRIVYKRAKTGRLYNIKVEPEAQEIIDRYKGKDGYLVDICNHYRNYKDFAAHLTNGLRAIGTHWENGGKRTGKPLFPEITQYWCRHSWATTAYELDVPMEIIAQALGHSFGSKTTSIYIRPNQAKADAANRKVIDCLFGLR